MLSKDKVSVRVSVVFRLRQTHLFIFITGAEFSGHLVTLISCIPRCEWCCNLVSRVSLLCLLCRFFFCLSPRRQRRQKRETLGTRSVKLKLGRREKGGSVTFVKIGVHSVHFRTTFSSTWVLRYFSSSPPPLPPSPPPLSFQVHLRWRLARRCPEKKEHQWKGVLCDPRTYLYNLSNCL